MQIKRAIWESALDFRKGVQKTKEQLLPVELEVQGKSGRVTTLKSRLNVRPRPSVNVGGIIVLVELSGVGRVANVFVTGRVGFVVEQELNKESPHHAQAEKAIHIQAPQRTDRLDQPVGCRTPQITQEE